MVDERDSTLDIALLLRFGVYKFERLNFVVYFVWQSLVPIFGDIEAVWDESIIHTSTSICSAKFTS